MPLKYSNQSISSKSVLSLVLFCFTMTCSMPCVGIIVAGKFLSCFSILTILVVVMLLFRLDFGQSQSGYGVYLYAFLAICLITGIIGKIYFNGDAIYSNAPLQFASKIVIYLILSILLFNSKLSNEEKSALFYGLITGAVLNLIWASLDGLLFYISGISINNKLFSSYININHIRYGQMSLIYSRYNIRTCGFNYDPAHIGVLTPFVFGYAILNKKKLLIVPVVLSIITSQSTTALVCCLFVLIAVWYQFQNRVGIHKLIPWLIISAIVIFIVYKYTFLNGIIDQFINRIASKSSQNEGESHRIIYNTKFLTAAFYSPISFFIGTGLGTSSFPFYKAGLINEKFAFDPEQTYVSYLFDTGIIGLIIYIVLLFKSLSVSKYNVLDSNTEEKAFVAKVAYSSILAIMFSNFFYHYICNAFQIIAISIIICYFKSNILPDKKPYEKKKGCDEA